MWRTRGILPVTLASIEVAIVAWGLQQSVTWYLSYVPATLCASLIPFGETNGGLLQLLALPLTMGLLIYILDSAIRDRRWTWVAAAGLSITIGVAMVLFAYSATSVQIIVDLLGKSCGVDYY